jgi:hypothetical protein
MRHLLLLLLLFPALSARAETPIPEPLQPWRDWVLHQHPTQGCPLAWSGLNQPVCAWPGRLVLEVDARGARFEQQWQLYREDWVVLPGDGRSWPRDVRVNGQPHPVIEHDGRPALRLGPGKAGISGELRWEQMPQALPLAPLSGLVELRVDGVLRAQKAYTEGGALLLAPAASAVQAAPEQERESLRVFNKLSDGIPLMLESVLELNVSGNDRELLLGRWLPEGAELLALHSELPARIESDGRLRVQARAGEWRLRLQARFDADRREFRSQQLDPAWPAQEIWSFAAAPEIRGLSLGGATAVDPARVELPPEWAQLPAYLLDAGSSLLLEESYRGDTRPRADELSIRRELWLDFDGAAFTARDAISGTLHRGWRLRAAESTALGRVSNQGEAQLITRLPGESSDGIELRQRQLEVEAVSRIAATTSIDALGWQHDAGDLQAVLHLPPGWRLWHASGVDGVGSSWVSRWDLWDIFLLLITVVLGLRLLDWRAGAVSLLLFALDFHQAPQLLWLWLLLLLAGALHRIGMPGRWGSAARLLRGAMALGLALALLQHVVQLARQTLYPQLEQYQAINAPVYGGYAEEMPAAAPPPAPADPQAREMLMRMKQSGDMALGSAQEIVVTANSIRQPEPLYDEKAVTQTGPGEPTWHWRQVNLHWSGPVTAGQPLVLVLSSPTLTRLINVASVLLWVGLIVLWLRPRGRLRATPPAGAAAALLLVLLLGADSRESLAQEFPPAQLLEQLEQRLTQAPDCAPQCAAIGEGELSVTADSLQLRLRIDAEARVHLPLPAARGGWEAEQVLLDGVPATALAHRQGRLTLALESGRHEVLLRGRASGERIDLGFVMPVRGLRVVADGWVVSGLRDGQVQGGVLQLQRTRQVEREERSLQPNSIAPFVRVHRSLQFGNEWRVLTRIERIAPQSGAIHVDVPLLPGETLTADTFTVVDGKVRVNLAPSQPSISWSSRLEVAGEITLQALPARDFVESWELQPGPQWHLQWQGLTPVKDAGMRFLPWPGESLRLALTRPDAVAGAVQTVESLSLHSKPGQRAAEHALHIELRASQAGDYRLQLPEGAELQSLRVDGAELNAQDSAAVVLPVRPGLQQLDIEWRESGAMDAWWRSPAIGLSTPAANMEWRVEPPADRWLLWLAGPAIGPAMLYWGVLLVIVAVALLLGRAKRWWPHAPPLGALQWLLLGIGMSTANQAGSLIVVLWLFALAARGQLSRELSRRAFNALQLGLAALTVVALLSLLGTIPDSLLSSPDMQVAGNGSHAQLLQWYQDRGVGELHQATVISAPIWVYRIAMLLWSLWLAWKLIDWLRWGWGCFSRNGLWRRKSEIPDS